MGNKQTSALIIVSVLLVLSVSGYCIYRAETVEVKKLSSEDTKALMDRIYINRR